MTMPKRPRSSLNSQRGGIMIRSKVLVAVVAVFCMGNWTLRESAAQRSYSGSTAAEIQYSGNSGIDLNGRAINVDGRTVDRYGLAVDDYGWPARTYRTPVDSARKYYGQGNSSASVYSSGVGGASFSYSGSTTRISPPRSIVVGGVYPSRTVLNNATRGTVIEYTHNGNGYISTPGSTYQTVISSGPSIFPYTSVVQPSQPPVIIESRQTPMVAKTFPGNSSSRSAAARPVIGNGEIKLICPKESAEPLTYMLNGTVYSIKPGYSQTFPDDRGWMIE